MNPVTSAYMVASMYTLHNGYFDNTRIQGERGEVIKSKENFEFSSSTVVD